MMGYLGERTLTRTGAVRRRRIRSRIGDPGIRVMVRFEVDRRVTRILEAMACLL
jgi:hypothetical protein